MMPQNQSPAPVTPVATAEVQPAALTPEQWDTWRIGQAINDASRGLGTNPHTRETFQRCERLCLEAMVHLSPGTKEYSAFVSELAHLKRKGEPGNWPSPQVFLLGMKTLRSQGRLGKTRGRIGTYDAEILKGLGVKGMDGGSDESITSAPASESIT